MRPRPPAPKNAASARRQHLIDIVVAAGALLLTLGVVRMATVLHASGHLLMALIGVPVLAVYGTLARPVRFAAALGAVLVGGLTFSPLGPTLLRSRSFFGTLRVVTDPTGRFLQLVHGSTVHGAQALDPASRHVPLTYFHPTGPIGDVFRRHVQVHGSESRVAVVGLGTGTLAAYAEPRETWTFYEINPDVVRIATDARYFTFLRDAFPTSHAIRIDVGDARLGLAKTDDRYSVLVIDAFTSDAIPVHLLTVEAMHTYANRLQEDGLLAFHCSNNYLDLEPVLARIAESAGFVAYVRNDEALTPELANLGKTPSEWVAMARRVEYLGLALTTSPWRPARKGALARPWTDDSSSIVTAFR